MSDQSQGPGWWEASDDKWYPPELHPEYRAPEPAPAPVAAEPARDPSVDSGPTTLPHHRPAHHRPAHHRPAPARRLPTRSPQARWQPWYRQPWAMGAAALLVLLLGFLLVRGGGGGDETAGQDGGTDGSTSVDGGDAGSEVDPGTAGDEGTGSTATQPTLYPDRPDRAAQDLEREVGDGAQLAGYTTTVLDTEFRREISELETVGYLVVEVRIVNRRDEKQPYNMYDWQLVGADGTVIDPALTTRDNIGSGELEPGDTVTGDVIFEVGSATGDFYLVYKPDLFDAARGIWMTSIP